MYFVSPSKGEQFFLRLLLTIFESGKSWEHLRTWNSQVFATFKETCIARGLLEDDHEWRICLEEAISMQPGMACHQLLTVILLTDEVAELHLLWDQFKAGLCDDVKHKLHHMNHYQADQEILEDDIYDYGLWDLNRILVGMERSLADFPPMPLPQQQWTHRIPNPLLQAEQYNIDEMATLVNEQRAIFNPDQAAAFNAILESVTNNQPFLYLCCWWLWEDISL